MTKQTGFIQSNRFFLVILAIFVFESVWIALSAGFPMAFDEGFHFGIIRLYAKQWSPFFAHQPAGGNAYGALTTDPSYLYHYLMSFPYRLTALLTTSQTAQIITLRCIDIALVTWSLILFRKILLKTKASKGIVNTALLFFILVPVVPLLAAQINYDDLLLPLTALAVLTTMRFTDRLSRGEAVLGTGLKLLAVCMLASLVQYEFLPIFVAITLYIGFRIWRSKQHSGLKDILRSGWHVMNHSYRIAYLVLFFGALALFGQRYGTNLVAYKTPVPQCNQVLSIKDCSAYTPWERNYVDEQRKTTVDANPLAFSVHWIHAMFYNSFFTDSSGSDADAFYIHVAPLPIVSATAVVVGVGGLVLFIWYRKDILGRYPKLGLLLFVSALYCSALWLWNYQDFLHLGADVALNGRYLFPVLPFVLLSLGLAYQRWLKGHQGSKAILLAVVVVLFLQGGGALTFIEASNANWYWPGNRVAQDMNAAAQKVIRPVIVS